MGSLPLNFSSICLFHLITLLSAGEVDVNVTPDKRQIFLSNEKLLLATVKVCALEPSIAMFASHETCSCEKWDESHIISEIISFQATLLQVFKEHEPTLGASQMTSAKINDLFPLHRFMLPPPTFM